jgi:hypothetical protein
MGDTKMSRAKIERSPGTKSITEVAPWGAMICGAFIALGSLLPWAQVTGGNESVSVAGTKGDGVVTVWVGLAVVAFGFMLLTGSLKPRRALTSVVVACGIPAAVAAVDYPRISHTGSVPLGPYGLHLYYTSSVGLGVYMVILAGAAGVFIGAAALRQTPKTVIHDLEDLDASHGYGAPRGLG